MLSPILGQNKVKIAFTGFLSTGWEFCLLLMARKKVPTSPWVPLDPTGSGTTGPGQAAAYRLG